MRLPCCGLPAPARPLFSLCDLRLFVNKQMLLSLSTSTLRSLPAHRGGCPPPGEIVRRCRSCRSARRSATSPGSSRTSAAGAARLVPRLAQGRPRRCRRGLARRAQAPRAHARRSMRRCLPGSRRAAAAGRRRRGCWLRCGPRVEAVHALLFVRSRFKALARGALGLCSCTGRCAARGSGKCTVPSLAWSRPWRCWSLARTRRRRAAAAAEAAPAEAAAAAAAGGGGRRRAAAGSSSRSSGGGGGGGGGGSGGGRGGGARRGRGGAGTLPISTG
jgi:uncharacterized membrane protein YgcG